MQEHIGPRGLATLDQTRIGWVEELVDAVKDRLPFYTATIAETGDTLHIVEIENRSTRDKAILVVRLRNGKEFRFEGTGKARPFIGDTYFDVDTVKPEANGTVPTEIRILDGGYENYANTPEVSPPRKPTLTLTLKDKGAEEHNAPLIAHHKRAQQDDAQKRSKRHLEEVGRATRKRQEALSAKRSELVSLLNGAVAVAAVNGPSVDTINAIDLEVNGRVVRIEIVSDPTPRLKVTRL
jgi:hypothetical protein